ncbi:hypothetical protein IE81DRAFT_331985 [Ceraceosorus guamensis]|uniref:Uncharacterized protein n=1 Tax=Ceraceosorus guamensis TaxID=1522189 RepID=A0A316VRF7_9BASI|nr:hypothetical protein IE81DRAFT_331985 [Ceraceosorus guamensis]PWN39940.1 hypothetical protein IE81DRAFT_331985 [Ceraceosorus guamensis]
MLFAIDRTVLILISLWARVAAPVPLKGFLCCGKLADAEASRSDRVSAGPSLPTSSESTENHVATRPDMQQYAAHNHPMYRHPEVYPATNVEHFAGVVRAVVQPGDKWAYWVKPGTMWQLDSKGRLTQTSGDGHGREFETALQAHIFDATSHGRVVGKVNVPKGFQKGAYDVRRNPVHVDGPAARPSDFQSRLTLDSMRQLDPAESSSARVQGDPPDAWH